MYFFIFLFKFSTFWELIIYLYDVTFNFLKGGAVGAADVDCNETSNVLCMFPSTSECYKDSKESKNFSSSFNYSKSYIY